MSERERVRGGNWTVYCECATVQFTLWLWMQYKIILNHLQSVAITVENFFFSSLPHCNWSHLPQQQGKQVIWNRDECKESTDMKWKTLNRYRPKFDSLWFLIAESLYAISHVCMIGMLEENQIKLKSIIVNEVIWLWDNLKYVNELKTCKFFCIFESHRMLMTDEIGILWQAFGPNQRRKKKTHIQLQSIDMEAVAITNHTTTVQNKTCCKCNRQRDATIT